ncbi:hypothetical protein FEM48_Zijuj09G0148900 [Ziziphus jujuba var. spinosa]|uniref:Pentatricopeptide repeat-containing protein At4g38150-like n=1 Tax=Ziziphus jujuba var. spinosa TaxID=714518 RepID=A0A978UTM5_ZIZJJ|nr:pentatricopeptide repeat-containing protein At4g38150-like [Ziziphus jujuba var. spinosa]KAH7511506.1 hypothetical protein FEM48_ZijujUnG0007200 [Ziziphus jujuba var. spinosa]KAH7518225.1 hypothetical protein FEM48_Zijuj09G0148900 [Ziziphus jujuba var. spinosa]
MPSFQTRISKLIFNGISNPLSYSSQSSIHTTIKAPSFNLLKELRRFSSANDGEGGEMKNQNSPQQPLEPVPHRPLRGGKPFDHHRTRTPQFPEKNSAAREKIRDDPSDANSFLEKFKLGADKFSDNKRENTDQQVSEPPPPQPQQPPEDADEIFKKMKKTGLIPNAVAMLDGLCKDGLVQEAMKLFGLMREKGTIPEVVIYTAVVEGFCKAQKLDNAKRIFRKMKNNGINPNAFSYSVLIQGLYSCKNFEDAVEFCMEMLEDGHSPNVSTFVGLIDGLCREKGVEEAQNVIGKLMQKGFVLNDKAVKDFLNKKVAVSPLVWEAIFGKKTSQKLF